MKRFLVLVLVLTLCFIGCKEEIAEKPIEETKAPVEKVEVPEAEEPREETPTDVLMQDYVTINIEKDGVETTFSTEFNEELFNHSYIAPEFTSAEDFNFGDYGLFVAYSTGCFTAEQIPVYEYGLITSKTKSIEDATSLYNALNDRFQMPTSEVDKSIKDWEIFGDIVEKSHITYISEESDILGVVTVIDGENWVHENERDFLSCLWNGKYELIDTEKNIIKTEYSEDIDSVLRNDYGFKEIPSDHALWNYTVNGHYYLEKDIHRAYENNINRITVDFYPTQNRFIKEKEKHLTLSIDSSIYWTIEDYDGERYILLNALSGWERGIYALFCYDIVENKLELLENHASHATLSPDGKYLAYTSPILTEWDTADFGEMKAGFYIKELETGKTVFYNCEEKLGMYCQFIAGWVNEEKLLDIIA